jgi:hypothetical protein
MYHAASSEDYTTDYLHWPEFISRLCVCCHQPLKYAFAGNGKLIRTLDGPIHQIIDYYTCENSKCELNGYYFNPAPRYDFGTSYFGKDVLRRVAKELLIYKQTPELIHLRLTEEYKFEISLRSVQRMCRDILLITSDKIDQETREIIQKQGWILISIDGQDPGKTKHALWLFTDAISGRVLKTVIAETMTHSDLHTIIETIRHEYKVPLIGTVSDKQNNLVKCMQTFYPDLPHQYCTFHFLQNLWDHLEMFDNQVYLPLKSLLNDLYIHDTSRDVLVNFSSLGLRTVVEVFAALDQDLQKMQHCRSKKFHNLRGLWLFRTLKKYVEQLDLILPQVEANSRIHQILQKTIGRLQEKLGELQPKFAEDLFLFESFKTIELSLYSEIPERAKRQIQLDNLFGTLWAIARCKDPSLKLDSLLSFRNKADTPCASILGEWTRLWNSYLTGLFKYYEFPAEIRTNVAIERGFSHEKVALMRRMGKKEVSEMIETYGELYLRLGFSDPVEIRADIVNQYDQSRLNQLRNQFEAKWQAIMQRWLVKTQSLKGIDQFLAEVNTES